MRVYIHLFAQRYPACARPMGVERLSIVEVNKKPSLTKGEQTAAVCSGFPNKHSTRRVEGWQRHRERGREREVSGLDSSCLMADQTVTSHSSSYATERDYSLEKVLIHKQKK